MVWCAATVTMASPVCLVDNGPDGHMRVQQEALQILEQIQQPVVVVAVVGLYRTGKSYLMNRLAGKHTGFSLGSTIQSKTKGIWMWCVPHPSKPGHTLVLLDTEGLGDIEKGDEKHDTWIFCLAVLLSSTLVYNSMGTIDNTALEKLQYVTELTEHIKVKSSEYEQSTELMRVFPSFVWTVRDFTLELVLNGKPVTADQYLENALKLKPGHSEQIMRHNQVRQGLRDFFAERRCFVFERPTSTKKMHHMEELTDADLDPDFVKEAQEFCSYIFSSAKPKTMRGGLGVTGRMLGSLTETYVQAIRSGQVPCLDSAVESLALIQNSRAVDEALEFYQREMERWVQLPTETQEALSSIHAEAEEQAISMFINASFNDQKHTYQLKLMESVCEQFGQWRLENEQESRRVCERLLRRVFAHLERMLRDGSFMHPGGHALYSAALLEATKNYRAEKRKGLMSEEVLGEFLRGKEVSGRSILQADRHISAAEKKTEECRVRSAVEEARVRALEEARVRQEQQVRDEELSFGRHKEKLQEKMEMEQRRAQQERHRLINAKLQEHTDLLERGFAEKAQALEQEVAALRREAAQGEESMAKGSALSNALELLGTAAVVFMPGAGKVVGVGLSALARLV